MIEKILGEQQAKDIYYSAMLSGLMNEKQAENVHRGMSKSAAPGVWTKVLKFLGGTGKAISGVTSTTWDAIKYTPSALAWTAALGGGLGVLGATFYDSAKKRLSSEDPETKKNNEIESIYTMKKKELEDSMWMSKIRSKRDELRRSAKNRNVSNEDYRKNYKELLDTLEERA